MKAVARCVVLLLGVGVLAGRAYADGKFFTEVVPADIPYQRALIIFHENVETLILQSKYELSQSAAVGSLGWVVPVPAVPEMSSLDADVAHGLFRNASWVATPDVVHVSACFTLISLVVFLGGVALLLLCLVEYPFRNYIGLSKTAWWRRVRNGVAIMFVALGLMIVTAPHLGIADVEVVKAEKAGIYDVKVIRGDSTESILNWLSENGFRFGNKDGQVFGDYVDRKWCFVTAKVAPDPQTESHKISFDGMVAPLVLEFPAEKPIYPLALTSTIGAKTEVLLYTLSMDKITCGERLPLRVARKARPELLTMGYIGMANPKELGRLANLPEYMMLCKFKGRLTSEQMKRDLEFEPAPDNEPYRETVVVW